MQQALEQIVHKYDIDLARRSPIEIPNTSRDDLGPLFAELGYKTGVELGVERAKFSKVLCEGNPEMLLFGVDAWASYSGYREHVSQEKLDEFYAITIEKMRGHNFVPIRAFSMDALHRFEDGSLDFVYVDANHKINHVIQDIHEWQKKVRIGGMICGHDYRKDKRMVSSYHVIYAVNAYTAAFRIEPWFLLGRKAKVKGEKRDGSRSWFWIKTKELH